MNEENKTQDNDKKDFRKKKGDPRSAFSYGKQGSPKGDPTNPGKQNHLFSRLKQKYGADFVNMADVYKEFANAGAIEQLIRAIYGGRFDFNEFGIYLANPVVLSKMIERADLRLAESIVHSKAIELTMNVYQNSDVLGVSPDKCSIIAHRDLALQASWSKIFESLVSAYNILQQNPQNIQYVISPIVAAVNFMNTNYNCMGTKLYKVI